MLLGPKCILVDYLVEFFLLYNILLMVHAFPTFLCAGICHFLNVTMYKICEAVSNCL